MVMMGRMGSGESDRGAGLPLRLAPTLGADCLGSSHNWAGAENRRSEAWKRDVWGRVNGSRWRCVRGKGMTAVGARALAVVKVR